MNAIADSTLTARATEWRRYAAWLRASVDTDRSAREDEQTVSLAAAVAYERCADELDALPSINLVRFTAVA